MEGDHYLTAGTPAQREAVDAIIADAQADLLRKARPPVVLTAEQTADLAAALPAAVAAMGLGATAAGELASGAQDVFAAACADPHSGLHARRATRARRGRGCACCARWLSSPPATW